MAVYSFGSFNFDTRACVLTGSDGPIHLRPRTYDVLRVLIEGSPHLITKEELLQRVWETAFVSDSVLAQAVSELRSALGDRGSQPRYIETRHRKGYRFKAPVVETETGMFVGDPCEPTSRRRLTPRSVWIHVGVGSAVVLAVAMVVWLKLSLIPARPKPVILLMDSARSFELSLSGRSDFSGNNFDDLTDLLEDLPVTLLTETTRPAWGRERQIRELSPELIVLRHNCFYDSAIGNDEASRRAASQRAEQEMASFLDNIAKDCDDTQFLVYSSAFGESNGLHARWTQNVLDRSPGIEGRLYTFALPSEDQDAASFRHPETGAMMRLLVASILGLE